MNAIHIDGNKYISAQCLLHNILYRMSTELATVKRKIFLKVDSDLRNNLSLKECTVSSLLFFVGIVSLSFVKRQILNFWRRSRNSYFQ